MKQIPIRSTKRANLLEFLELREFLVEDLGDGVYKVSRDEELPVFLRIGDGNIFFEVDLGNIDEIASQDLYFQLLDLNTEILQVAFDIATGESAELQICHAFWILSERVLPGESQAYVTEFLTKVKEAMTQLISPFELSLDDRRVHILNGDPSKVIPPLAAKEKIDLLVMGTISRAGVAGLLIGNTAERMLQAADCSVLVIKPERFVSPLTPQA